VTETTIQANTTTQRLEVPGAILTYDVRKIDSSSEPPLLLVGSPMGASGFTTLASFFPDRTIVTYDPRGCERSVRTDDATTSTTEQHADDLHRVIKAIGGGPVDMFASSGGAVNALSLAAKHPAAVLPDRDAAYSAMKSIADAYQRSGFGAGMARFIAVTGYKGTFPDNPAEIQGPSAAQMGMPTDDDGTRNDPLLGQNMGSTPYFEPDFEALRASPTHIILGVGADSQGQLTYRATETIAARLGTKPVVFPGGHAGFLGGPWAPNDDPAAFAVKLHEVLAP
jgi:pimeloyl-ACP methyl ester carboxylesterase